MSSSKGSRETVFRDRRCYVHIITCVNCTSRTIDLWEEVIFFGPKDPFYHLRSGPYLFQVLFRLCGVRWSFILSQIIFPRSHLSTWCREQGWLLIFPTLRHCPRLFPKDPSCQRLFMTKNPQKSSEKVLRRFIIYFVDGTVSVLYPIPFFLRSMYVFPNLFKYFSFYFSLSL